MTPSPVRHGPILLLAALACGVPNTTYAEPATVEARAPTAAPISGTLRRRGVRGPAPGVEIRALAPDGSVVGSTFSDGDGRFALTAPPGSLTLGIDDPAYAPEARAVELPPGGLDLGAWALTPAPGGDDAIEVYGRRPLTAVGLDAEELGSTAGTLGDPLRAVQSLPSVGTILSVVPFPIVRGSAPGETGVFVDGTPIPLLFHSGVGQGVVPAVLVDRITLHPGGAPLSIGRHTSAIEVETAEPDGDGLRGDVLLDLVQSGALVSAPLGEGHRLTVSGRVGYPGWILSLLDQPMVIDFADYHLRYSWRDGRRRARISLFGATDTFGDADTAAQTEMAFHRLALRWLEPLGDATLEVGLDLGFDQFDLPRHEEDDLYFFRSASGADIDEVSARARLVLDAPVADWLRVEAGVEGAWIRTENHADTDLGDPVLALGVRERPLGGAWIAGRLRLGPVRLTPGVRVDVYGEGDRWGVDPRLDARIGIGRDTAVVGRAGVTHAPQRYPYPIPGIGEYTDADALERTVHGQLGLEQRLPFGLRLRWSAFARRSDRAHASGLDPILIEYRAPNGDRVLVASHLSEVDRRIQGAELMLRRRPGGWFHGWLSYTVQRVEQRLDDAELGTGPWVRSALEQNHLLNAALSLRLPGRWSVGGRLHYTSGRLEGVDAVGLVADARRRRLDGFVQLDLRVEYRWVADLFEGSAWLDVVNVTHAAEPTRGGNEPGAQAYTLPMLGVRARF